MCDKHKQETAEQTKSSSRSCCPPPRAKEAGRDTPCRNKVRRTHPSSGSCLWQRVRIPPLVFSHDGDHPRAYLSHARLPRTCTCTYVCVCVCVCVQLIQTWRSASTGPSEHFMMFKICIAHHSALPGKNSVQHPASGTPREMQAPRETPRSAPG